MFTLQYVTHTLYKKQTVSSPALLDRSALHLHLQVHTYTLQLCSKSHVETLPALHAEPIITGSWPIENPIEEPAIRYIQQSH